MSISELPYKTLQDLYSALEWVPTLDWKMLMTRGLHSIYSKAGHDVVAMIENSARPAKALLDDLTYRKTTLQDLVEGLEAIQNNVAVSIVKEGAQKNGLEIQCSGGRPPPQVSTGNPQEQDDSVNFSRIQCGEQDETLYSSVKVSEARESSDHPASDPGLHTSCLGMMIFMFSSCLYYRKA